MTKKQIAEHIVKRAKECFEYANGVSFLDTKKEQKAQIFAYWEMYFNCFANGNPYDDVCESLGKMYDALEKQISEGYDEIFKKS